jgi:hypothetical protein
MWMSMEHLLCGTFAQKAKRAPTLVEKDEKEMGRRESLCGKSSHDLGDD